MVADHLFLFCCCQAVLMHLLKRSYFYKLQRCNFCISAFVPRFISFLFSSSFIIIHFFHFVWSILTILLLNLPYKVIRKRKKNIRFLASNTYFFTTEVSFMQVLTVACKQSKKLLYVQNCNKKTKKNI